MARPHHVEKQMVMTVSGAWTFSGHVSFQFHALVFRFFQGLYSCGKHSKVIVVDQ